MIQRQGSSAARRAATKSLVAQRGLAVHRELREVVEAKLEQRWSPEQSADRL